MQVRITPKQITIKKPEDLVTKDLDEVAGQFKMLQLTDQLLLLLEGFLLGVVSGRHQTMLT